MRRFFINKVENMRDIGGYSIDNFKIVKEGKLLRSNCVTNLTNEDIKQLTEIGFDSVIDLRCDEKMVFFLIMMLFIIII